MIKLQNCLKILVEAHNSIGVSASIMRGQSVLWSGTSGRQCLQSQVPVKPSERFLVYSLTKTYIAAMMLKLAEAGRVDLDACFSDYLSDSFLFSKMTVRQLLNHTSGMPDYGSSLAYHNAVKESPSSPWTEKQYIEYALQNGMIFEVGSSWGYSNIGYMLLGHVIKSVTGCTLADNLSSLIPSRHFFRNTSFVSTLDEMNMLIPGFSKNWSADGQYKDIRKVYHPGWVGHGVIAATAEDVVGFYRELLAGILLTGPVLHEMLELVPVPFPHPFFKQPSYGLGIMADAGSPYGRLYGHTGDGPGYCAAAYHLLDHDLTIAVLCNSDGARQADGILFGLLEELMI